ncbi:MAG: type IV pilus twitching motility protein PilT [Candidatus Sumerlaeia bacterium]|nr:type IV pilus twitching motility protein PilT [Candidatus Sumerlaeia bacterium]
MSHGEAPPPIQLTDADDLASILIQAIEKDVSDIHLTVGNPPMFRLHGSVTPTTAAVLDAERMHKMLYDILSDDQRKTLERDKELDFAMSLGKIGRLRANCFYTRLGEAAVFRVIPTEIKTLEDLGSPPVLKKIAEKPRGLVLVTGPTGSGKSTTLAAMVDYINNTRDDHILTIEDPVEFVHRHKRCIVNQREVGPNTKSFAAALRSALREDPDIILVGELRDLETISLALTASETGHLVFGTLHTQSAPKTCDRIIDVFPPTQQGLVRTMFAESFQAIISQTLLKKVKGGRVCAMEIMLGTSATRSLIREGKTYQLPTIIQTAQKMGMQSLDQVIKDLLMRGVISQQDALMKCNNPDFVVRDGEKLLETMQGGGNPSQSQMSGGMGGMPSSQSSAANPRPPGLSSMYGRRPQKPGGR